MGWQGKGKKAKLTLREKLKAKMKAEKERAKLRAKKKTAAAVAAAEAAAREEAHHFSTLRVAGLSVPGMKCKELRISK